MLFSTLLVLPGHGIEPTKGREEEGESGRGSPGLLHASSTRGFFLSLEESPTKEAAASFRSMPSGLLGAMFPSGPRYIVITKRQGRATTYSLIFFPLCSSLCLSPSSSGRRALSLFPRFLSPSILFVSWNFSWFAMATLFVSLSFTCSLSRSFTGLSRRRPLCPVSNSLLSLCANHYSILSSAFFPPPFPSAARPTPRDATGLGAYFRTTVMFTMADPLARPDLPVYRFQHVRSPLDASRTRPAAGRSAFGFRSVFEEDRGIFGKCLFHRSVRVACIFSSVLTGVFIFPSTRASSFNLAPRFLRFPRVPSI